MKYHVINLSRIDNKETRSYNQMSVTLQPYEWIGEDVDDEYCIRVYGHTRATETQHSRQVLLRINDYKPMCRIAMPLTVGGKPIRWNRDHADIYIEWLTGVLKDHAPTSATPRAMETLYGYSGRMKRLVIECRFQSFEAMKHCRNLVKKKPYLVSKLGQIKGVILDTKVDVIHQMVVESKLGYGKWMSSQASRVIEADRISTCEEEWETTVSQVTPVSEEMSHGWMTTPMVAAIDIECYSSNHKKFPVMSYAKDEIFQISFITQRLYRPNTRKRTLVVTGECDDIEGADVIRVDNEIDAIDTIVDLINHFSPSIITGYNTCRFDFPYMNERLQIHLRKWKSCSLLREGKTWFRNSGWESGAYNRVVTSSIVAEGRLCVDMYLVVRRGHTLSRYGLGPVSEHFLGHGKHDVSPLQMFETYKMRKDAREAGDIEALERASAEMATVGDYCLEDSCLCIDLMEKLSTWIMMTELSTIVCVKPSDIFTRGQQLRVSNQVYRETFLNNVAMDSREPKLEWVKGASVHDPIPGKYNNVLVFDFASLYPSIIRALNLCYTTYVDDDSVPDSECNIIEWTQNDTGSRPKHYRYRFIKEKHYHGILPRLCAHLMTARRETRKMIGPENDAISNEVLNQRQLGLKVSANSIYGALGVKDGKLPLPEAFRSVTATGRQMIAASMRYVEETYQGKVVYGDTDSIMVDLGLTDPLDCLDWGDRLEKELTSLYPAPHRMEFETVYSIGLFICKKRYATVAQWEKKNPNATRVSFDPEYHRDDQVLYSIDNKYILVPANSRIHKTCVPAIGQQLQSDIIAGIEVGPGGIPTSSVVKSKGTVFVRRDNCLWLRESYTRLLLSVLFDRPLTETLDVIRDAVLEMMTRRVPFDQLVVTQTMGGGYKETCSHPMKLFKEELRKRGYDAQQGERLDYVIVRDAANRSKRGERMRILPHYHQNKDKEPLDLEHYVSNLLSKPVDQVFALVYYDAIAKAESRRDTPKRGQIITGLCSKVTDLWVKSIRLKAKVVSQIS